MAMKKLWCAAVVAVWCGACTSRPGDTPDAGTPQGGSSSSGTPSSSAGPSSAPAGSSAAGSSLGSSSVAGSGPCAATESEIHAWVDAHLECNVAADCVRLSVGLDVPDSPGFCDLVAAPGGDLGALRALTAAWDPGTCSDGVCGFEPGVADCSADKRCVMRAETPCDQCDFSDVNPVCTEGNQNAVNACVAQNCLMDPVAAPGLCRDSAACDSAGGQCHVQMAEGPHCPAGSLFDVSDPENGCAQGNWASTCCTPTWEYPCTFLGNANPGFAKNPFTCQPSGGADICAGGLMVDACSFPVALSQFAGNVTGEGTLAVAQDGTATLTAESSDGATTTCTGVLAFGTQVSTWSCNACTAGGSCQVCSVPQSGICRL